MPKVTQKVVKPRLILRTVLVQNQGSEPSVFKVESSSSNKVQMNEVS